MSRHQYRVKKRKATPILDPVAIGRRVREARKARGWRQYDLAMVSGIDRRVVGAIEIGIRVPSRDAGIGLAVALRRSLEWLYFGLAPGGKLWRRFGLLTTGGDRASNCQAPGTALVKDEG